MNKRKRVLVFSRYMYPGFRAGGPVRSLMGLAEHLGEALDISFVSLDRDAYQEAGYHGIVAGVWAPLGSARVRYENESAVSMRSLTQLIRDSAPDIIYLNGFFDVVFTLRVLLLRRLGVVNASRVVLAPRGEFSPSALRQKKLKKRLLLNLLARTGMLDGVVLHASTQAEKADVVNGLSFVSPESVEIAQNLVGSRAATPVEACEVPSDETLRACLVSRVAPMKNIDFLLRSLRHCKSSVFLDIFGPAESTSYLDECRAIAASLPPTVVVRFLGEIDGGEVSRVLSSYSLFVLPTRGENFGHAIVEAMMAGVPVVISDRTPWSGVGVVGGGWVLPISQESVWAATIDEAARLGSNALKRMGRDGRDWAARQVNSQQVVADNFRVLTGGSG